MFSVVSNLTNLVKLCPAHTKSARQTETGDKQRLAINHDNAG